MNHDERYGFDDFGRCVIGAIAVLAVMALIIGMVL